MDIIAFVKAGVFGVFCGILFIFVGWIKLSFVKSLKSEILIHLYKRSIIICAFGTLFGIPFYMTVQYFDINMNPFVGIFILSCVSFWPIVMIGNILIAKIKDRHEHCTK
ncbi:MAG: hypothetical protein CR972_03365 [Candidatus Moraniibacteriota bacterium]|nr:MAG: hypothetical protein CR972_03365 [Candidatus Moranbacteria bacterium]